MDQTVSGNIRSGVFWPEHCMKPGEASTSKAVRIEKNITCYGECGYDDGVGRRG